MLTQVAEGVLVHQSELLRNNTAVVQGAAGVLLIDPGITDEEMACLSNDLRDLGQPVVAGFSTHPDWDHVLWHAELGDAPRYGTARCAAVMRDLRSKADWKAHVAEGLPLEIAEDIPLDPFGLIAGLPAGTAQIPWDGPRVRIIQHPAHAPGHAALLIEDRRVLVAGDMLSDVFIPMLDEWTATNDPIEEYLMGLRLLEDVAGDVDVVIPGHGSVGRADKVQARIEQDRAYVHALRDAQDPRDPRIGPSVEPGWEWVSDIHAGQAQSLARRREGDTTHGGDVTTVELVGGVEKRGLFLVEYDPRWPQVYAEHERRIRSALGPTVGVEHTGSTSVPGLAAKPIIDILITVEDITAEEEYLDPLLDAGYELRVREPGHRLVRTPARDVHVHIREIGSQEAEDVLLFRDRLCSAPEDRDLYERTKRALLEEDWPDMNAYADAKTAVITEIKERARKA